MARRTEAGSKERAPDRLASLPLRLRLPNAPPIFVGRDDQSNALAAAIERAPVSMVWGLGGLGKTSLVLATLHARFADRVPRTVMVSLPSQGPRDQLLIEALRSVSEASRLPALDWPSVLSDRDASLETLIDLAERGDLWVVLDDIHRGDPAVVRDAMQALSRYARRSRWIATSREHPRAPGLDGQVLALRPMTIPELQDLAWQISPGAEADEVSRAVEAAAGSPWRLRRVLTGAPVDLASSSDAGVLSCLDDDLRILVEALAVLDLAIPAGALTALGPLPSADAIAGMERRGLVERNAAGIRLHDMSRSLVRDEIGAVGLRRWADRVAPALAAYDDDHATLEALRLFLEAGAIDRAAALLAERTDDWFARGHAPRLWRLLENDDARLDGARIRCAVQLGDASLLSRLPEPPMHAARERMLWARMLLRIGRADTAAAVADELCRRAEAPEHDVLFGAQLLLGHCLTMVGRTREASAVLEACRPADRAEEALRESMRAMIAARLGDPDAVADCHQRVIARLDALDAAAQVRVRLRTASALIDCGRLRDAKACLEPISVRPDRVPGAIYAARLTLLQQAIVAIHAADLREGAGLLEALVAHRPSWLAHAATACELLRRTYAGELGGVIEACERLVEQTSPENDAVHDWAESLRTTLATLRGDAPFANASEPTPTSPSVPADARSWVFAYRAMAVTRHRRRAGRDDDDHGAGRLAREQSSPLSQVRAFAFLVGAEGALVVGRADQALALADSAVEAAREQGWGLTEIDALQARCEALLVLDRAAALVDAARELQLVARTIGSPRFEAEADLFLRAGGDDLDLAAVEQLADSENVAPVAARRARAVLGGSPRLDAIDRVVVAALRKRHAVTIEVLVTAGDGDAAWAPGWGLDLARRAVWLPGGRTIELQSKPLFWRILEVLGDNGGTASKEELVTRAWGGIAYHALRDDKRLQVAMRRLRELVEEDPSTPLRLVTTADGYAFGAGETLRRAAPTASV